MTRAHIFYSGMVQGVGFRYMTQRFAKGLSLVGWVKNLPDGRVEIITEGPRKAIDQLIDRLSEHFGGYIKNAEVDFQTSQDEFRDFKIAF